MIMFLILNYLVFVSPHTLMEEALPKVDLGTSTTMDITLVPAKASTPGFLKPG
jgi:hypothetical protein